MNEPIEPAPMSPQGTIASLAASLLIFGLLLFVPAGTLSWTRGWLFLLITVAMLVVMALVLWRVNPVIFRARSRIQKGTKAWDRVLLAFLFPALLAILPVAALDDARFHWTQAPFWVVAVGYLLVLAGIAGAAWAQAVNRFFEPGVRIQTERGHRVIDTGPYAYVRHPGYISACLLFAGMALALGSFWALIPAAISIALLVLRTTWEERTLRAELAGYGDYVQRVSWRYIPGIW